MKREDTICCAFEGDSHVLVSLQGAGLKVAGFDNPGLLVAHIEKKIPRVLLISSHLGAFSLLSLIPWVRSLPLKVEIVVLLKDSEAGIESELFKQGAFDIILGELPNADRITLSLNKALEASHLHEKLESFEDADQSLHSPLLGKSPPMLAIYEMIRNVAPTNSNVLVLGESGTGKELIAKAIHSHSLRADKSFVVVNCAALPSSLIESELFGYVQGAFTGANQDKPGLFETADGGTLFLDEIGEISLAIQVKLLRALQEGEIRRLGDGTAKHVDVRLIAATNCHLEQMVAKGTFREDLYYRLNVIEIKVPPLRERKEDIPLLAQHYVRLLGANLGRESVHLTSDVIEAFKVYAWPGNVRELENVLERAVVLGKNEGISLEELPSRMLAESYYSPLGEESDIFKLNYKAAKKRALHHFNRSYIINALERAGGNVSQASEFAGMDRSNFKKIIRQYLSDKGKTRENSR